MTFVNSLWVPFIKNIYLHSGFRAYIYIYACYCFLLKSLYDIVKKFKLLFEKPLGARRGGARKVLSPWRRREPRTKNNDGCPSRGEGKTNRYYPGWQEQTGRCSWPNKGFREPFSQLGRLANSFHNSQRLSNLCEWTFIFLVCPKYFNCLNILYACILQYV